MKYLTLSCKVDVIFLLVLEDDQGVVVPVKEINVIEITYSHHFRWACMLVTTYLHLAQEIDIKALGRSYISFCPTPTNQI